MTLTYQQIDLLNSAYLTIPFKKKAISIAGRNIAKLKPFLDTALAIKVKLIKENNDGKEKISTTDPGWDKFIEEYNTFFNEKVEVNNILSISDPDVNWDFAPKDNEGNPINIQGQIGLLYSLSLLENVPTL